jgi:DtxR family Mn-dependent transcriptional regulator
MTTLQRPNRLTMSVEDYLKAIFAITHEGQPATTSAIARSLDLSAPSVSSMIKRLSERGLVEYQPYKGVELTPAGRSTALRVLRRHRVIESYLVGFLGYTWDSVHDEAERLEHAVSDILVDRMAEALGDPQFDPHGDPIPAPDGTLAERQLTALPDLPVGTRATLRRVDTNDSDQLRYIGLFGLKPGTVFTVQAREPFQGPVTVSVAGQDRVIGRHIATALRCEVDVAGEA